MNKANKIFNLLLLTLSFGAILMTIIDTRNSLSTPANFLAYVPRACPVLVEATVYVPVPCHNHATASAYASGRLPAGNTARTVAPLTDEQAGGCVRGGAGYDAAITWLATGRVERVSNWATAGALTRNFPVTA